MNRLRLIRTEREMSGVEIAEVLGISPQYYYDLERGKRNLSATLTSKLAVIFGVSTDYLLGVSANKNSTAESDARSTQKPNDSEEYSKFLEDAKKIADQYGYDLRDPKFLDLLNKALAFVDSVKSDKVD